MRPGIWTPEMDSEMLKLWTEGKSASDIAVIIGYGSRNSVIGRLHRLKAQGVAVPEHVQAPAQPRKRRLRARVIKLVPFMPPKPMPRIVDTLEGSVPLYELTGCKWPVTREGPHRFCNRERFNGSPYCEGHAVRSIRAA